MNSYSNFDDHIDDLTIHRMPPQNEQEHKREAFRYANASLALEGFETNSAQLARQEDVIQGRLTTKQAIAQCIAEYS